MNLQNNVNIDEQYLNNNANEGKLRLWKNMLLPSISVIY